MANINEAEAVDQASLEKEFLQTQQDTRQQLVQEQEVIKVKLNDDGIKTDKVDETGVEPVVEDTPAQDVKEDVQPEGETKVEDEIVELSTEDSTPEPVEEKKPELPEWVQKMVDFHADTGGGVEDYLNYTKDYSDMGETQLLKEYYKLTKPQYSGADIDLFISNKFGVEKLEEGEEHSDEDKLKLLALKDEVYKAQQFLKTNKDKYYADLKSGVHGAPEQYKEAVEFYDKHKKSVEASNKWRDNFLSESKKVLNEEFRGFTFESDGKKYRLKVGDAGKLLESQSDINKVLGTFIGEDGNIVNHEEYHRALWAGANADKIFKAGMDQGKAEALKDRAKATKNPDYNPQTGPSQTPTSGPKVKFLGNDFNNEW